MFQKEPNYCYYIYNKTRTKRIVITPWGVSVEYRDGGMLDTNIYPLGLYPDSTELDRGQQESIAKNAVEGYYYTPEQMQRYYDQWKQQEWKEE